MLSFDVSLSQGAFDVAARAELPMPGITVLFGASGAGKSTLLRTLAGFERAAGRIHFDGEAWLESTAGRDLKPHRRPVGYVFQDGRLFSHLTVAGNLRFAERRGSAGAPGMDDVVRALALEPLLERDVGSLSGGEQRRVALGRTLLTGARVLLLDEPFTGLDAGRKHEVMDYVERLPELFDVRVLLVTHSVDEVVRLATDMVVMEAGRIIHVGDAAELLERLDVQALSGEFEAGVMLSVVIDEILADGLMTWVRLGAHRLAIPEVPELPLGAGLRLHVRARDVALAVEPPRGLSIRNQLPGQLLSLAREQGTPFVEVLVDVEGQHVRARVTRLAADELSLREGQPVYVLIKSVVLAS